jgi:hypothetical protein
MTDHKSDTWVLNADVDLVYDSDSQNPVNSPIRRVRVSLAGPSRGWIQNGRNVAESGLEGLYTKYDGIASSISVTLEMKSGEARQVIHSDTPIHMIMFVSNGRVEAERIPMDMIVLRTEEIVPHKEGELPLEFVFGRYDAQMIEDEDIPSQLTTEGIDLKDFSIGQGSSKWLYGDILAASWNLRGEQASAGNP